MKEKPEDTAPQDTAPTRKPRIDAQASVMVRIPVELVDAIKEMCTQFRAAKRKAAQDAAEWERVKIQREGYYKPIKRRDKRPPHD